MAETKGVPMNETEYGVFIWATDNRYPRSATIHVYKRRADAQRRADKLNADPETAVPRGWVVRTLR